VHDHGAVIVSWRAPHVLLELVKHHVEAGIAVDVHVELIAQVPVDAERPGEEVRVHQPLPPVSVLVAGRHLHRLRVDRAIGE